MPARYPVTRPRVAAACFVCAACLCGGAANAQPVGPAPNIRSEPAPVYMPFVWQGNALDQAVLDAQAQMSPRPGPPHRPRLHHARRR